MIKFSNKLIILALSLTLLSGITLAQHGQRSSLCTSLNYSRYYDSKELIPQWKNEIMSLKRGIQHRQASINKFKKEKEPIKRQINRFKNKKDNQSRKKLKQLRTKLRRLKTISEVKYHRQDIQKDRSIISELKQSIRGHRQFIKRMNKKCRF